MPGWWLPPTKWHKDGWTFYIMSQYVLYIMDSVPNSNNHQSQFFAAAALFIISHNKYYYNVVIRLMQSKAWKCVVYPELVTYVVLLETKQFFFYFLSESVSLWLFPMGLPAPAVAVWPGWTPVWPPVVAVWPCWTPVWPPVVAVWPENGVLTYRLKRNLLWVSPVAMLQSLTAAWLALTMFVVLLVFCGQV